MFKPTFWRLGEASLGTRAMVFQQRNWCTVQDISETGGALLSAVSTGLSDPTSSLLYLS